MKRISAELLTIRNNKALKILSNRKKKSRAIFWMIQEHI